MKKDNIQRVAFMLPIIFLPNICNAEQINNVQLTTGERIFENEIHLNKYDNNVYLVNDTDGTLKAKSALSLDGISTTGGATAELDELLNFEIQVESSHFANIEKFSNQFKIKRTEDSLELCDNMNFKFQGNTIISEVNNLTLTTATSCKYNIVNNNNKKLSQFKVLLNYTYKDWCSYLDSSNEAYKTARAISQTCSMDQLTKTSLKLNNLRISDLSPLTGFINLRKLNLENNNISHITYGIFDKLSNLSWLILSKNSLTYIHKDAFKNLAKLEIIWLMENKISSLPSGIFDHNPKLNWISLQNNELHNLEPDIFNKVTSLQSIELSNNYFSYFPLNLSPLKELASFEINENNIQEIPENTFHENTNLVNLSFSGNKINNLPVGIFTNLSNLVFLNMSDNNLSSLPKGIFDNLFSLENLDLILNPITCLPKDMLKNYTKLENTSEQSSISQCVEE